LAYIWLGKVEMAPPIFVTLTAFVAALFSGPRDDSSKLLKLFATGNAAEISTYFSSSVQLTTPGKEGVYSKAQARMILSDFFSANTPTDSKLLSQGNSENGAQFLTISLFTRNGDFKVSMFYRGDGHNMHIHELKIEK
jgi:hypothetical protein